MAVTHPIPPPTPATDGLERTVAWQEEMREHLLRYFSKIYDLGCGIQLDSTDRFSLKLDGVTLTCGDDGLMVTTGTFVLIEPTATADNVVVAQSATVVPLTLKGASGQSVAFLDIRDSADQLLAQIDSAGRFSVGDPTLYDGATPIAKFSVGSADNSNQIGLSHDNTHAHITWDDGSLKLTTDEGTNTDTTVQIRGKGTGEGFLRAYDQDDAEYISLFCSSGEGFLRTEGSSPGDVLLQNTAHADVTVFQSAASGETRQLEIHGYRSGDANRSLQIGVGVDAADTASFDGVSTYRFDGDVVAGDGLVGAPAHSFIGDPDSGMWSPSANVVAFSAGGTEVMRANSTPRMGIGTTSLSSVLNIGGDGILRFVSAGQLLAVGGNLTLKANNNNTNLLVMNGTEIRMGGAGGGSALSIDQVNTAQPALRLDQMSSGTDSLVTLYDSGGTLTMGLTINGLTQAGAGSGVARFNLDHTVQPSSADGDGVGLNFRTENASGVISDVAYLDAVYDDISADDASLRFSVRNSATPAEAVRIDPDGNVGIGTTVPVSTLETDGSRGLAVAELDESSITLDATHEILAVNYTATGSVAVTLPSATSAWNSTDNIGRTYTIADTGFNAKTNNITISRAGSDTMIVEGVGKSETSFAIATNGQTRRIVAISASKWLVY